MYIKQHDNLVHHGRERNAGRLYESGYKKMKKKKAVLH